MLLKKREREEERRERREGGSRERGREGEMGEWEGRSREGTGTERARECIYPHLL